MDGRGEEMTSIYHANQTIGTLYHFASPAAASGMDRGRGVASENGRGRGTM